MSHNGTTPFGDIGKQEEERPVPAVCSVAGACFEIGQRLARLPGDRGWELLYHPHPRLKGMCLKEALDTGGWLDEVLAILADEESQQNAECSDRAAQDQPSQKPVSADR